MPKSIYETEYCQDLSAVQNNVNGAKFGSAEFEFMIPG